jgi:hypothetical protein
MSKEHTGFSTMKARGKHPNFLPTPPHTWQGPGPAVPLHVLFCTSFDLSLKVDKQDESKESRLPLCLQVARGRALNMVIDRLL